MYRHWRQDPSSVHISWQTYFNGLDKGLPSSSAFTPPPTIAGGVHEPAATPVDVNVSAGDVTDYLKVSRPDQPCRDPTE